MAYYQKYLDYFINKTTKKVKWGYFIFFVTNKCNARCKHCFYWKQLNSHKHELSLDEIEKISQKAGRIQVLLLSGGEPFLRKDLFEVISLFIKNNGTKVVSIPTNAILTQEVIKVTNKLANAYPKVTFSINPSIDDLHKKQDETRCVKNAFRDEMKTLNGLVKIKEEKNNVEVVVNTTISNFNYKDIDKIIKYFKKFNLTYHNFELLRGEPRKKSVHLPPLDEIKKIHKKVIRLRNYYIEKNNKSSAFAMLLERVSVLGITKYTQTLKEQVLNNKRFPFTCSAGKNIVVLEPNGDVRLCELHQPIGNLKDYRYDLEKLLKNKKAKLLFKQIRNCRCTHACFLNMSIAHDNKSLIKIPYYFSKWQS